MCPLKSNSPPFQAMISTGIPARFLANDDVKTLFRALNPTYKLPTRQKFANVLLPSEYERIRTSVEDSIKAAEFISYTSDGWTDNSSNRLMNVFVHTPEPYHFSTIDTGAESHSGEYIEGLLIAEMEKLDTRKVVAVLTDNAANMQCALRLVEARFPWIIIGGCKAHTIDLGAKDICNKTLVSALIQDCNNIVKFFR